MQSAAYHIDNVKIVFWGNIVSGGIGIIYLDHVSGSLRARYPNRELLSSHSNSDATGFDINFLEYAIAVAPQKD
ncbi:hypothetical protein D0A37_22125 [Microcoleus vaginatus HSN003]|nr:hypothetical protein D0A37_22125 [Microcoleus vaginatus HSN003]